MGLSPTLLNENLVCSCVCSYWVEILYTNGFWGVLEHYRGEKHGICLVVIHDLGMRYNRAQDWRQGPSDRWIVLIFCTTFDTPRTIERQPKAHMESDWKVTLLE